MQSLIFIFVGIIASIIGAMPFGLVNLSVLDVAYYKGKDKAMNIAHGAALIEVLFGLIAIKVGYKLTLLASSYQFIHYFVLLLPGLIGIVFLVKRNSNKKELISKNTKLLHGVFLNLISIQVLLYWLIAISFINAFAILPQNPVSILLFVSGIWIGKMIVLWFYSYMSDKIYSKWQFLSSNINRVIGVVLLFSSFMQFLKFT